MRHAGTLHPAAAAVAALVAAGALSACSSTPKVGTHSTPTPLAVGSATPAATPSATPTDTPTPAPTPTPSTRTVPAGFSPISVTFVSASTGFVLGTHPCAASANGCLALAQTGDGGHTWSAVTAPPTTAGLGYEDGVGRIRFADARNGWAFGTQLWSTHDGGAHWTRQSLPGGASRNQVETLEASAGVVHMIAFDDANNRFDILSSSVGSDSWTTSPTTLPLGAGPVPQGQLALQGTVGWAIEEDRTVLGGARLSGGHWTSWQPPCSSAGGVAALSAGTTTHLAAVCDEGTWTGPSQSVHVYVSSDGGASFARGATALAMNDGAAIGMNAGSTIVVGGSSAAHSGVLVASFDGGATWSTVWSGDQSVLPDELGFTTATQGVAITGQESGHHLLMTYDGGHHWNTVAIG